MKLKTVSGFWGTDNSDSTICVHVFVSNVNMGLVAHCSNIVVNMGLVAHCFNIARIVNTGLVAHYFRIDMIVIRALLHKVFKELFQGVLNYLNIVFVSLRYNGYKCQ